MLFECTFCADCAEKRLLHVCPNCGGISASARPACRKAWIKGEPGRAKNSLLMFSLPGGSVCHTVYNSKSEHIQAKAEQ
ncbi:DUF1272 domain-containing protein [Pantoea sp. LMR881]|uniref:DUF1272 domain-containing protein n=1 Tax=Pantoea sp. LMR881 TaxID=3014336 RepID=UPI003FA795D2